MGLLDRLTTPSPEAFAGKVMAVLRRANPGARFDYRADGNRIVFTRPEPFVAYLDNAYSDYCQAPLRFRKAVIEQYVRTWMTPAPREINSFDDARSVLLPRVRDRAFYSELKLRQQADSAFEVLEMPFRLLTEDIAVELNCDLPDSIRSVSVKDLSQWNVSFEEAMSVARENLWKISNEPFAQLGEGLHVSTWQDNHAASRMFLHDLIWQLPVKGDHVVMIPHRDRLIVTGSDDDDGLLAMAKLTEPMLQDNRFNLAIPAALRDGAWSGFCPSPESRCYREIRNLAVLTRARQYQGQKNLLEAVQAKTGDDAFIAQAMVARDQKSGLMHTFASWADGVHALLPQVDQVCIGDLIVPWLSVASIAGDLLEPRGLWPERFRVRQFPASAQLAELRAVATN